MASSSEPIFKPLTCFVILPFDLYRTDVQQISGERLFGYRLVNLYFHTQQGRTVGLALRVGLQRDGAAAIEAVVQKKVQGFQVRHFKAFDLAETDALKMFF